MKQKIWYIDHYDSFSRNVMDWLTENPMVDLQHVFFDDQAAMKEVQSSSFPIVLSPGPNHPQDIPQTISLIKSRLGIVPILGICLGHQALAFSEGFTIRPSENCFHGTKQKIRHVERSPFTKSLPESLSAATYNSLVVDKISKDWKIYAVNEHNEIQIMGHHEKKAFGVQFHPESFLSDDCSSLRDYFILACTDALTN